jgi:hypothetical protein
MPVEDAQPAGHRNDHERRLLTWALAMFDLEPLIQAYGLIPAEFGRFFFGGG